MSTISRIFASALLALTQPLFSQSPFPVETDVVVVGGTSAGVAAALEAKRAGASVCVLAPRTFLGEDLVATYRLVREDASDDPLFSEIFDRAHLPLETCPFTYTFLDGNGPSVDDRGRLNDGLDSDAGRDGVEFRQDAVAVLDLGKETPVQEVEVVVFRKVHPAAAWRPRVKNGYNTSGVLVVTSSDGRKWANHTAAKGRGGALVAAFARPVTCRYVKLRAKHDAAYPRQMLGEVRVRRPDASGEKFAPYTMPLRVKRAFDRGLQAAEIPVVTGAPVCDVLKDAADGFAGVVYAGRGGVRALKAKVLVDATERGWAAVCAGAESAPLGVGPTAVRRIVFTSQRPQAEGLVARDLGPAVTVTMRRRKGGSGPVETRFWQCEMSVPLADGSPLALAEADARLRDATFTDMQVDMADACWFTPTDAFRPQGTGDLAAYRPAGTRNVFVAGPRAAIPRAAVETARALGAQLALGRRLGRAAAETAARLPAPADGRPTVSDLPVYGTFDVVVSGGGTGGAPAGISAARQGARTAVCEFMSVLGGQTTEGRINGYYFGNVCGFTKEIDRGANDFAALKPQGKAEWYRREIRAAGGTTLFATLATGVRMDGDRITGVEVVFPDGRRGVLACAAAVDATGNADLAAAAGEETEFLSGEELSVQGAGVVKRIPGQTSSNNDIGFVDVTDMFDLASFARRARLSAPADTWDLSQIVGSRERRRLRGAFYMTPQDVMAERRYPDVVVRTRSNFDSHGQTADRQFFIDDPVHTPMFVNLPYRCMLPKRVDGLLVIGLGMSAHRDAMPILRMVADVQNQGYVAGYAAAQSAKTGRAPRALDVRELQRHFVEKDILPAEVLEWTDTFPLSDAVFADAVRTLPDGYRGLNLLLTDTSRALPLLKAAYATEPAQVVGDAVRPSREAKFAYAHVLALLGEADGAALLIARLASAEAWDTGWNFKGMSQFNRSVSWMDSYAIALGYARAKEAVPVLCALAAKLSGEDHYSHFRAVAKALELIGDPRGAEALARCLSAPNIGGHARTERTLEPLPQFDNGTGDRERTLVLREICLARALYRLGDSPDGLGRRTLEAYAADPRGAYAAHARLVLGRPVAPVK